MESDRALVGTRITDFGGLNTNVDPHDLKPGETVEQVNCGGSSPGILQSRNGLTFATFANSNDTSGLEAIACYPFQTPRGNFIIFQRSDGTVAAGSNPS